MSQSKEFSPQMKEAVRDVQKAYAARMRKLAVDAAQRALEESDDVLSVIRVRGRLLVATSFGVELLVEVVR